MLYACSKNVSDVLSSVSELKVQFLTSIFQCVKILYTVIKLQNCTCYFLVHNRNKTLTLSLSYVSFVTIMCQHLCQPLFTSLKSFFEQEGPVWWLHEVLFGRLAGSLQHRKAPGSSDSLIPGAFLIIGWQMKKTATFLRKVQT